MDTFSSFSNTVGLFETKYYVKGYGTTGMNIYTNGIGHMTKMAATPIYGKNPSKELWGGWGGEDSNETWYVASSMQAHHYKFLQFMTLG